MRGWIIDCYPDRNDEGVVLWFRTADRVVRVHDAGYRPSFYVSGQGLEGLTRDLEGAGAITSLVRRRTELGAPPVEVLKVSVDNSRQLARLARAVDRWGDYRRFRLYNVDLRIGQRYLLPRGLFPFGLAEYDGGMRMLESRLRIDYPVPPLRASQVGMESGYGPKPLPDDPILSLSLDGMQWEGREEDMLRDLQEAVRRVDPDLLLVPRGDSAGLGHILHRASVLGLEGFELGREKGLREKEERSYQSYGQTVYRPAAKMLRGRLHIDTSSFMYREGGISGVLDLSRVCGIPFQDLTRVTPGTAISSMQMDQALRSGHLVSWKKNRPEDFKTARQLIRSDRGGMIHQPVVGLHQGVTELDFSSLYPSIIVNFNISPETLQCSCCPQAERVVPELGYRICGRQQGLLPQVIRPIIERRRTFKRLAKERPERREDYEGRSKILKWLLVTCFGYTGYRNARFGRIECHESITAYGREILLRTSEMAEESGFRILHGIVDSLWLQGDGDVSRFQDRVGREYGIPLEDEGRYSWLVFLPNIHNGMGALNRYYGAFQDGRVKMRGIAARKRDCTPLVRDFQTRALSLLAEGEGCSGFMERVPDVIGLLQGFHERLLSGEVPREELVLTRRISRPLDGYRQMNHTAAALRCLRQQGQELQPGESLRYVLRDDSSRQPSQRVEVSELQGEGGYDAGFYAELLLRSGEELLSPLGWDRERLRQRLQGRGDQTVIGSRPV
ncbi:MAG: DNA polymerase domain-containing protein [Candidatus Methanomethylophilaceae archaeon]